MNKDSHLLIQGNFAPARSGRVLRMGTRILSVALCFFLFAALGIYGIKVAFQAAINKIAKDTREINEQNKELQVRLNRVRSFQNVESAAAKVPHLHLAEVIIDVPISANRDLPVPPRKNREYPRAYGY